MRVGQIRSVAVKLFEELNLICHKEKAEYYDSAVFQNDLQEFVRTNPICIRIATAFELLIGLPEYIKDITIRKVDETDPSYNRYGNSLTIDRDTDLLKEYKNTFDRKVEFRHSYNPPSSVEGMYFLLEYQTITASNLLEVEEKVKEQLKTEGFKVII